MSRNVRLAGISMLIFRPTGNIHSTASERKVQSSFQCWVLPRTTERFSFASPENPKARNGGLSDRFLRHFSCPQPPSSPKSPSASHSYPAGSGSAAIRRTMAPESRPATDLAAVRRSGGRLCHSGAPTTATPQRIWEEKQTSRNIASLESNGRERHGGA